MKLLPRILRALQEPGDDQGIEIPDQATLKLRREIREMNERFKSPPGADIMAALDEMVRRAFNQESMHDWLLSRVSLKAPRGTGAADDMYRIPLRMMWRADAPSLGDYTTPDMLAQSYTLRNSLAWLDRVQFRTKQQYDIYGIEVEECSAEEVAAMLEDRHTIEL